MFHKKAYSVIIITTFLIFFSFICFGKAAFSTQKGKLFLQIVKQPEEKILVEFRIEKGDCFYLDYTHSSDLTPVHDIFQIDKKGIIVLIEEDYLWYGSGLEFHPEADAKISFKDSKTRVYLHREFSHFLLRVGRVANHAITYKEKKIPLKEITEGGSLVWIRVIRK